MSKEVLLLVEAAVFQLRAAAETIEDPALKLTSTMVANAVGAAKDSLNAARVSDIEFAVNDLVGAMESLSAADAAQIEGIVTMLRSDIQALRAATALPPALVEATRAFQSKLRTRKAAVERQTYREGGSNEPLPHPPEELHVDAGAIRSLLSKAGFATPALDAFFADPSSIRFHNINDMINELDTIIG